MCWRALAAAVHKMSELVGDWGGVGDVEKTAFFEGNREGKISREEPPDILPQAFFHPPTKQASPYVVRVALFSLLSATSQLSWQKLTEPRFIRNVAQVTCIEQNRGAWEPCQAWGLQQGSCPSHGHAVWEPDTGLQHEGIQVPGLEPDSPQEQGIQWDGTSVT